MSNWTRAHDAHIARECEGLEVVWIEDWGPNGSEPHIPSTTRRDWMDRVAFYLTDPAAAIRAAEAWRKKDEDIDRTVTVTSTIERMGMPCTAECAENYREGDGYKWRTFEGEADENDKEPWAAALAQSMYRATGGPE